MVHITPWTVVFSGWIPLIRLSFTIQVQSLMVAFTPLFVAQLDG